MVQQMQKTRTVSEIVNHKLPRDPAIPLLSIYPKEMKTETQTDTCTPLFIAPFLHLCKAVCWHKAVKVLMKPFVKMVEETSPYLWSIKMLPRVVHFVHAYSFNNQRRPCYALSCLFPNSCWNPNLPPSTSTVSVFGDRIFSEITKEKWGHEVGPKPIWLLSL